jgi:hypothetical protein
MKAAYADPPYLGCGQSHYGHLHPDAGDYDRPETHKLLIDRLCDEFDAWALSLHGGTMRTILPMCPDDVRIGCWLKTFASFKPNVNPAYAWEPVVFRGARKGRGRHVPTVRDYVLAPITLQTGCPGAKPEQFCWWVFDFLGLGPDDEFHDLFPGSGNVTRAWEVWRAGHAGRPLLSLIGDA